jgi:hypothetical protein
MQQLSLQVIDIMYSNKVDFQRVFHQLPNIFNSTQIWRLWGQLSWGYLVSMLPFLGLSGAVAGSVVILKEPGINTKNFSNNLPQMRV